MTSPHKEAYFSLLKRYLTVWRNVWAMRKDLDPPKRDKDAQDFLPAQLELTETPLSPAPKWIARLIMLFAILALIWAWLGQLDIVVAAQGKTEPSGQSKIIQPLETAEVKAIHVADGQHVHQGDVLLELSAIGSDSDVKQSEQAFRAALLSKWRNEALIKAIDNRQMLAVDNSKASQYGITEAELTQAQLLAQNQYNAYIAQDEQIASHIQQAQAEYQVTLSEIKKLEDIGKIEQRRTDDMAALVKQHFIAKHAYLEQKTKLVDNQNSLQSQRNQLKRIQASIDEAQKSRRVNEQNLRRDTLDAIRQANEQIAQISPQIEKAQQRQQLLTLKAPVSGTVQQLAVHTIGGVVTAAQSVMVIVPDDYQLHASVWILNKDIGFIRQGQPAVIKIEAFPYTRYGYITGKVEHISYDAIENEKLGLIYAATIKLDKDTLMIDGQPVRLSAGMNLTAEIKTGKRSVLDYLLSPLQTKLDESLKQR